MSRFASSTAPLVVSGEPPSTSTVLTALCNPKQARYALTSDGVCAASSYSAIVLPAPRNPALCTRFTSYLLLVWRVDQPSRSLACCSIDFPHEAVARGAAAAARAPPRF